MEDFSGRPGNAFERFFDALFRVISVVAGIIFTVTGTLLLLLLFVLATGISWPLLDPVVQISVTTLPEMLHFWFPATVLINVALAGVILVIGIPLLLLVFFGVSLVFNLPQTKKGWQHAALLLWLLGIGLLVFAFVSGLNQIST